jgi:SNF2 family DNA or RNA helicase
VRDLRAVGDREFARNLSSFLARRAALLQICSHPGAVVPGYSETPAKLLALDSLLDDLIGRRGEKVLVWSFFRWSLDAIVSRYSRLNAVRIDGTVSDAQERRRSVRRFQEDDHTMLFVGNPAAAGMGITLHRARFAIYESMSNQAAHYLQSLDRVHRRGQQRDVEYILLLCDRSLETQEYERLTAKEAAAQALLRDAVAPPLTREAMLEEILLAADSIEGATPVTSGRLTP